MESYAWYIYIRGPGWYVYIYTFDYHLEGVYWAEDKALTKLKTHNKQKL